MIHIEPLRPDAWTAAFEHALQRVPLAQRPARVQHCLELLENGILHPRGIFVAREADAIRGVQVCVPLAGSTCLFWLPAADQDCAEPLVQAGLAWASSIGCKLAQAAVAPEERALAEPLVRCGFVPTTRMHQLAHDLDELDAEPPTKLRCECYRPSLHAEFAATLERTYEGTRDCPELNGKRTIEEILAGHRGQGKFYPEFWWLVRQGTAPVGVVLLAEMPDAPVWELAYLGIVPEQRRRGIARTMTLRAMHALRARAAARLLLAVDTRNTPALELYRSLGFVEIECNDVLLYFF